MKGFKYHSVSFLLILSSIEKVKSSEKTLNGYKNEDRGKTSFKKTSSCIETRDIKNDEEDSSCSCKASRITTQKANIEKNDKRVSPQTNVKHEDIATRYERKINIVIYKWWNI